MWNPYVLREAQPAKMLLLSVRYIAIPSVSCLRLLIQLAWQAFAFARLSAGKSMAARIAMIAITTSNSMRVKAMRRTLGGLRRQSEPSFRLCLCMVRIKQILRHTHFQCKRKLGLSLTLREGCHGNFGVTRR